MLSIAKRMEQTSAAGDGCVLYERYLTRDFAILTVILCYVDHVEVSNLQKKLSALQQERDSLLKQVNGFQVQVFYLYNCLLSFPVYVF